MNFDLNEEQQLFCDAVERFVGPVDIAERRQLRGGADRYPTARWSALADLGLLALAGPEAMGGLGGERIDLALVAEAFGQRLAIDPWLEAGVLPVRLAAAANDAGLVDALTTGRSRAAVAFAEPGRRYGLTPAMRASEDGELSGSKTFVLGVAGADVVLVTALAGDGFALYAIPATAPGVSMRRYTLIDGSLAAEVRLFKVTGRRLAIGWEAFLAVIGDVRLLAAAEMVGLTRRVFDDTLDYVKQREQFGVAIGSFQAIQHRLVDCYAKLELARSLMLRSALEPSNDWPTTAAATKAYVASAAMEIAEEAVQLHGGMGQTDDVAVGHALKRIMLLAKLFGDADEALIEFAIAS